MATAKELYELADILDDSTVKLLGEKYNVKAIKDIANLTREQL
jgi:hypothetical protein